VLEKIENKPTESGDQKIHFYEQTVSEIRRNISNFSGTGTGTGSEN
jgi:hypothetical protein